MLNTHWVNCKQTKSIWRNVRCSIRMLWPVATPKRQVLNRSLSLKAHRNAENTEINDWCDVLFLQLEKERVAIECEKERMAEDEAKLMERKKDIEKKFNEEMGELQSVRDRQVNCVSFVAICPKFSGRAWL